MSNPYEAPAPLSISQESGLVRQVRVVSVLMMVQGALDLLVGLAFIAVGVFMGIYMRAAMQDSQIQESDPATRAFSANLMTGIIGGQGAIVAIIGALNVYAGFRNWKFKGRTMGIISLVAGIGTIFGVYCAPTSLALCIYGLIVYLNSSVARAFRMGKEGYSGNEIVETFSPVQYGQSPFQQ